ncbi:MAG: DUF4258 domain-containing protein [Acidobacteria bacterium]|nr:DUF4258 domain-containing protein [Acidobacteriota bacterium]MCA1649409.1 DUF4258 domain-containing protein [Acidobacteriota bacterium]
MAGDPERLIFRVHAIQRMFQRGVTVEDVRQVLTTGETIENYPEDTPYPSRLVLGRLRSRPLHVVFGENKAMREIIVVTVYEPDPDRWDSDFRLRRA